ncbi:tyrosine-type recombinase/integrase [Ligilactobacillus equi]|uniref:Site-specific tyrosine recombinase XerC n=1 Tax=Ligilactobacillus equi DPC 6820 TaxID=1392007 RepID=V7HX63_9LACO|nr:site-specific tyrosine recombinase XerC [Ligilactobacillus equi DPC 6820]
MDFISNNPFDKVVFPKRVSEGVIKKIDKKDNFFTKQELNDFLTRLQVKSHAEQKYTLFRLLDFSGMRVSEALSLNWQDIYFDNSSIQINKTIYRGAITQKTSFLHPLRHLLR